ncbi:MAG: hypothetical protein NTW87_36930 [Planctomycetota bacterium]|nr:hypothetical protein [Planctomycetota bacterium]
MELFTMKHAHRKHRMNLVSLHPAKANGKPAAGMYFVSCGAYRKGEKTGRMEYQGLALEGGVPVKELVRWAKRKGFLKWHRNGQVQSTNANRNGHTTKTTGTHKGGTTQHERHTDGGNTPALSGTANGGNQR